MNQEMEKAFGLSEKIALVTGGGTGLGYAITKALVAAGAKVIIVGRHADILEKACESLGKQVSYKIFDVCETDRATELIKSLVAEYGHLDILVNNAGIHCKKAIEDVSMDDLQKVLNVHVFGSYALTQAVIPVMRKQKSGSIIFISSMSALIGLTQVTAYSAAKAAVLGLVKTITSEVAADGIRVNAIVPGFIDTPMFRQATQNDPPRQRKILGHTPMEEYGSPDDIGWAAVYLAGQGSRFVTGTTLVVDGGCAIGF